MRLVGHPNVVDLRAFFYSNGDRVSCLPCFPAFFWTDAKPLSCQTPH